MNEMKPAPVVAAFHDLSSVGRCALTVVIPVISAMGVQVYPAPTAVLSAHTAFSDFVSKDLTGYLDEMLAKWQAMKLKIDAVYTGYLASVHQGQLAQGLMELHPEAMRIVDPVLGDDGRMYRALPDEMPEVMRHLCKGADIITPNLTEACLLTGITYPGNETKAPLGTNPHCEITMKTLERLFDGMASLDAKRVLLTGVNVEGTYINVWTEGNSLNRYSYEPIQASYPGTGDLFTSVLTGAIVRGAEMHTAVKMATEFVSKTMAITKALNTDPVYGVQLELTLQDLTQSFNENQTEENK